VPIIVFPRLLLSLLSWAILAAAAYLLWDWYQGYDILDADGVIRHVSGDAWLLYVGAGLVGWSFLGRFVVLSFIRAGADDPREQRGPASRVMAPDGSALHVETTGPTGAPTLILTHGWGLNATAWYYAKRALAKDFRVVTWDLPGLGRSKAKGKITIDGFAAALGAVVQSTGPGPVVLVGHSIGGMTTQTFWRACPEALRRQVVGAVLVDTTYENPLKTMVLAPLWRALRFPLIEPLCWLTVVLSPLAWIASWQGYLSGSNQLAMRLTGFGKYATRGQVDLRPAWPARGRLEFRPEAIWPCSVGRLTM
jgi:pimeloyl-ACP methyl ester carboxylesterase